MARLRTCDVMSGSGVPTGAPGRMHLLGMVRARMAGKVYKPMTATQNFWASVPPKNIQCIIVRLVKVIGSTSNNKSYQYE